MMIKSPLTPFFQKKVLIRPLHFILWGLFFSLFTTLSCPAADDNNIATIKSTFAKNFPQVGVTSVLLSPVPGFYQVGLDTGELLYVSSNARYFFAGDLLQMQSGQPINLTEQVRLAKRQAAFKSLDKKSLIIFDVPVGTPAKAIIYVFTDTDCAYCRRFHAQVSQLNQLGIRVNYLAWPRAGLNSPTARVMESVWCAKDRKAAMNAAKLGSAVKSVTCKNPIAAQFALGQQMGVRGTPAIFTQEGQQIGGI